MRKGPSGPSAFPVQLDAKSRWDAHIKGTNPSTACIALDHRTPVISVAGWARRRSCRGQFRACHRAHPIRRPDRPLSDMRHAVGTGSRPLYPPCRRPSHDGPHRLSVPADPPFPLLAIGLPAPDLRRASARGGADPQTAHLAEVQRSLALGAGGELGSRLATRLAMPVSGDTLLRLIRAVPVEPAPPARVIGIDD